MKLFRMPGLALVILFAGSGARADSPTVQDARVKAAAAIEQDTQRDPNNAELWLHLGFARQKLDQLDGAAQAFEKAGSLDPKNLDAFYMLGLIYEKKHQTPDALRVWKAYLAASPAPERRNLAEKHIHQLSQ